MPGVLTRRNFLERTAGAAALIAWTPRAIQTPGMFLSLNGSVARGVSGADKARLAARVGFGGVDWDLGPARTTGVDATKALFAELKIKPTIVNLPVQIRAADPAAFAESLTTLDEAARFTAAIGCQTMMVVLPAWSPTPKEEFRRLLRDRLAAISEILGRSNIRLGLEFLGVLQFRSNPTGTPFIWRLDETVALARDCGPNIGAVLDVWHWHHSGGTTADILAAGKSRIFHVHVSDARQQPPEEVRDNERLMPGEGIIDLVGFFQALKQIGYTDGVSPEPLGRVPLDMSAEDGARLALDTTTAVMKQAGVI